jgi:hypothetical protein
MAHRSERLRVVVATPLAEQNCELIERLEPRSRFSGSACSASVRRRAALRSAALLRTHFSDVLEDVGVALGARCSTHRLVWNLSAGHLPSVSE